MVEARFTTLDFLPPLSEAEEELAMERGSPPEQGRGPMQRIAEAVRAAGGDIAAPLSEWESYGWSFAFAEGAVTIECMLQWGDEWLLMCWPHRTLTDKLRGRKHLDELERGSARLAAAIARAHGVAMPAWRADA